MKRRLLTIILIILLLFNLTVTSVMAVEPVTLSSAVYLVGKLLVAAGVTFYAADGVQSAYNHWYGLQNNTVHGWLDNAIQSAVNGVITVSNDLWNNITDFVRTNYHVGSNAIQLQSIQSFPGFPLSPSTKPYQAIGRHGDFFLIASNEQILRLSSASFRSVGYDAVIDIYRLVNGVWIEHRLMGAFQTLSGDILSNFDIYSAGPFSSGSYSIGPLWQSANTAPGIAESYQVNGSAIVDLPNYDFTNIYTGERSIILPTSYDANNLVGVTYDTIPSENPNLEPITYPNSWYGTWASSGAGQGVFDGQWTQGNNTTDKPMVGVPGNWIGDWFFNPDGSLTWDGSYSDGAGNVWEGKVSGVIKGTGVDILNPPLTPTLTGITDSLGNIVTWLSNIFTIGNATLNFQPLRLSLSNKFPFSIPWDFYNAIESLNADPEVPRWELPIVDEIVILDFAIFNPIARIIRWGVLVSFTFSLILITRSLIKG